MAHPTARTLLVVGILLLSGCSGVISNDDTSTSAPEKLRVVVQNDLASAETITLTFTSEDGETILNETQTIQPNGGWVVTTLTVSELETPVTVTVQMPDSNYTNELTPIRSTDRGSRLHTISEDGINLHECNTNITCWQQYSNG